jgi:hypothetical protein
MDHASAAGCLRGPIYSLANRQRCSTSSFSSSWSHQSRDDQNNETLRHHGEWMQYMMIQVNIFKYANFPILYKYCLIPYLMTSCSKGTLCTVCHRHCFLIPPHRAIHRPHTSTARRSMKLLFCIEARISIIKHA